MIVSILGFLVHKKYTRTLLRDENFFSLIRSNGVSKNPSFHTDFKNVSMTLVKNAPKKSFAQKPIFFGKNLFLGAHFTKVICALLKSVWKDGFFDAPFKLFTEKKFSSLRRDNELSWELKKVKNGRNRSKFRKMVIYKQSLDFHCPSKILCHTSNLWNFVKITGLYSTLNSVTVMEVFY